MADDNIIMGDFPPEDRDPVPAENGQATGGELATIRTMNSNLGAVRVQVSRDIRKVRMQIGQLATYFGDSFEYALPFKRKVKDEKTGRWLERKEFVRGPSIRCTTAVARAYGNCSIDCSEAKETPAAYVFDAAFLDVETGFRLTRPFRQRKDQNIGGMGGDTGRVEDVLFQVGASKATRNVIRNALPDLCEYAIEQARSSMAARIEENREEIERRVMVRLEEHRIPLDRVEKFYGAKLNKMNARVIAQIIGMLRAVADGMLAAGEVCPAGEAAPAAGEPVPERPEGEETEQEDEQKPSAAEAAAKVAAEAERTQRDRIIPQTNPGRPLDTAPPEGRGRPQERDAASGHQDSGERSSPQKSDDMPSNEPSKRARRTNEQIKNDLIREIRNAQSVEEVEVLLETKDYANRDTAMKAEIDAEAEAMIKALREAEQGELSGDDLTDPEPDQRQGGFPGLMQD